MSKEGYEEWQQRVMAGRDNKPLEGGDIVSSSSGKPFATIKFANTDRQHYYAEVGQKGLDFIFHFYAKGHGWPANFEDQLGDAFLKVFRDENRVGAAYVEEFGSWGVKCTGFAENPLAHDLCRRLFDELDKVMG